MSKLHTTTKVEAGRLTRGQLVWDGDSWARVMSAAKRRQGSHKLVEVSLTNGQQLVVRDTELFEVGGR
jgi:hypothetical protein